MAQSRVREFFSTFWERAVRISSLRFRRTERRRTRIVAILCLMAYEGLIFCEAEVSSRNHQELYPLWRLRSGSG